MFSYCQRRLLASVVRNESSCMSWMKSYGVRNKQFESVKLFGFRNFSFDSNSTSSIVSRSIKYVTSVRSMAGHSKWQNVKHIKAEKDRLKSTICARVAWLARVAVREGGHDPKLNNRLADVFEMAQKNNVPFSIIEKALKKAEGGKMKPGFVEIVGPGGCLIVLDYETDNVSDVRRDIKGALKKHDSQLMQGEGRWRAAYEQKGILKVIGKKNEEPLIAELAQDYAIEAGAEDVQLKTDDEHQEEFLEFFCAPEDLHQVKKELERMLFKIEEAYVGYIPNTFVELSPADMQTANDLIADLEDIQDIVRIYENIK